jgi:hypothetical protein
LRGIVTDSESHRACAAEILASSAREPTHQAIGWAKDDGRFQLEGLVPDTYAVCARTSGGRCGILRGIVIEAGKNDAELVIPLNAGAKLRLRYEGDQDRAYVQALQGEVLLVEDFGVQRGHDIEWTVTTGHVVLRVHANDSQRWTDTPVDLAAGETREIVLGKD